jgi:hypothetical protein
MFRRLATLSIIIALLCGPALVRATQETALRISASHSARLNRNGECPPSKTTVRPELAVIALISVPDPPRVGRYLPNGCPPPAPSTPIVDIQALRAPPVALAV